MRTRPITAKATISTTVSRPSPAEVDDATFVEVVPVDDDWANWLVLVYTTLVLSNEVAVGSSELVKFEVVEVAGKTSVLDASDMDG